MLNILVVDDEKYIRELFKIRLEAYGYTVTVASDGEEALDIFYSKKFDMIIIDIMMPKLNGIEFINQIRKDGYNTPAIIVSARDQLETKKESFLVGVDDYMVKPIEFDELILRMNSLFRRAKIATDKKIVIGDVTLDYETLSITNEKENKKINLTKKEFSILFKLLSYPEKTFTKGQLYDEFWGYDSYGDLEGVKVYISKIRSQIEIFPEIDIATIRGIGYRGIKNEKK
ncbi:MAG: response regulator transcription factor [Bacillales bacterium]|nr:response regulator transcription factor [Bacillales bacterium]